MIKEAGYIEIFINNNANTPVYYDNFTVTMRGSNASEVNAYYPSGYMITDLSSINATTGDFNAYKYNDKEWQKETQWLDFGARMMDPVVGRWFVPDPLAEKYYWISPYAYCANNPINAIDPNGEDFWLLNELGEILKRILNENVDAFYIGTLDANNEFIPNKTTDADGNIVDVCITFDHKIIESQRTISFSPDGKTTSTYDVYQVRGDDTAYDLFNFLSDNITAKNGVEFSQVQTGVEGNKGLNFITTSHQEAKENGVKHLFNGQLNQGYYIRDWTHSHRKSDFPTGLEKRNMDIGVATTFTDNARFWGYKAPTFHIYHTPSRQRIQYKP